MKNTAYGAVAAMPCHNPVLKTIVVSLAGAGLLSAASGVWAQAAPAPEAEAAKPAATVVTVTGVRQAARNAQLIKQNAEQVLDSIVAEDIGKFPDKNVAEILGRVTGVQIVREGGEAGRVVIRGLGNVGTLLNGREVFTAANRGIVLSDIPVAMLQRVDVYKTQGADMVEGGVAGVVDVRTFKPFDFKDSVVSLVGRVENRNKAGSYDPNLSTMASKRWKGTYGEIGALAGVSYQRGRYHDEVSWVAEPMAIDRGVEGARAVGRVLGNGDRKRIAVNGAVQWRPNSDVELYADLFSTKIDHISQSIFFIGDLPINKGGVVTTVPGTNYLSSITHPGASEFTLSSTQARDDMSLGTQTAVGGRWDITSNLRATTEYVRTVSNYTQENPIVDVINMAVKPMSAGIRDGGGYVDYPGYDMTNPAPWNLFGLFDNHNNAKGRAHDLRVDLSYDLGQEGFLREVTGGVRLADRTARYARQGNSYMGLGFSGPSAATALPGMTCVSPSSGGRYGLDQFYAPCHTYLLEHTDEVRAAFGSKGRTAEDPMAFFDAQEKTTAIYLKAKYGFNAGPVPVDGNVGVRVVKTDLAINDFSRSDSPTDVLPSMTVRAKFKQNLIGRFVAGKAMERAAFGDYNPFLTLSTVTPTTPATGVSGNPNLKAQEGRNMDLALEWYFAPTGSLTGTIFNRDFKNYIRRSSKNETYGGVVYRVDRPYNTVDGKLEGFELAYQQFYENLPGWMSGLGLQANVTFMKGGLTEVDTKTGNLVTNDFAGMSKLSYNIVGLYERDAWSARVAYNWRDKFVAEYDYRGRGFNLLVAPIKTLDGSISYKINKQLTVSLDANNLLDTQYNDYHGVPELARDIRRYDRAIGLSLRWKN